jgi:hypothetical protein
MNPTPPPLIWLVGFEVIAFATLQLRCGLRAWCIPPVVAKHPLIDGALKEGIRRKFSRPVSCSQVKPEVIVSRSPEEVGPSGGAIKYPFQT